MDKKIIQKPLVSYLDAELKEAAENFSKRHNLRFCTPREIRKSFSSNLIILITNKGIFLQDLSLKNSNSSIKSITHPFFNIIFAGYY